VELGFGPELVRRYPPDTRHFGRAVANLRQGLGEMVRQRMASAAPGWASALGDLLDRAGHARMPVAVVGSLALAVRAQEGPWPLATQQWTVASPFEEVTWEGRVLRVPPLELLRRIEVSRQRPDRVAAIDDYCAAHGRERQG
jgi:hypothetical protein